jgi:hypothetical protein
MSRQTNLNQSVVFLDAGVTDYQSLQAGVIPGLATVILSANQDGIEQITAFLQQNPQITTIHLVSHGAPGCLYLGNCQLNLTNIYDYRQQLQSWAKINRILLYGCQVAAGDAGEEFIEKLHQLTGATVMASATPTGSSKWGGDWDLEAIVSRTESEQNLNISLAFDGETLATYEGVFALSLVGNYDTPGEAHDVKVVGNYAYVADFSLGLQIIDISTPDTPTLVGNYDTSGSAQDVQVIGNYAYVADYESGLQIIDVSNPENPTLKGNYSDWPLGGAYGLEVVGNYAYVASDYQGLTIIDISNPSNPTLIGNYDTSSRALEVQVIGNYAYVADYESGLQIIDISNPENPTLKGNYDTPGIASDVEVVGNYAYLADGWDGGLQIIDISNPTNPIFIGNYDTNGVANDVEVVGNYAYLADDMAGLKIIDISNPTNPTLIDYYDDFSTVAYGVEVVGNYAYLADYFDGLKIIDVSNFNNPSPLPSVTLAVSSTSVTEDGTTNLVYTFTRTGDTTNLLTVNFTTVDDTDWWKTAIFNTDYSQTGAASFPSFPSETGTVTFAANSATATVTIDPTADTTVEDDETVSLTLTSGTDYTVGTTTPVTGMILNDDTSVTLQVVPSLVTEDGTSNLVYYFYRDGVTTNALTVNYTVGGTATFNTDYSQTGAASFTSTTGTVTFAANATTATVTIDPTADNMADPDETVTLTLATGTGYTVGTTTTVTGTINDDINPPTPTFISKYDTPGWVWGLKVVGNYAYLADWTSGLQIIDISNPTNPTFKGNYDTDAAYGVEVVGNYAYIADGSSGLQIIDISNPTNPTFIGNYDNFGAVLGVQVVGNYAYLVNNGASSLEIIDISNPTNPTLKGSYDDDSDPAFGLQVVGNYAYLADGESGLKIIDISNPTNPILKGSYDTSYAFGVQIVGNYAYVADWGSGLQIIDISNPTNPILKGSYYSSGQAANVQVIGNYAYLAAQSGGWGGYGLQIIDISNPTNPTIKGNYQNFYSPLSSAYIVRDVQVVGNYAYAAGSNSSGAGGLQIIDVSDFNDVNESPTDVTLSNNSVAENSPLNTLIGNFTTTDPDTGNTFNYSLVTGIGSTDNSLFTIDGNQLKTNAIFDYETKNNYSIRVKTTDQAGLSYEKQLTVSVTDVNENPTNLTLSNNSVGENSPLNTLIGNFTTTDPDTGNTFNYSLVTGIGSTDNSLFTIDGNQLKVNGLLDYETKNNYSIRVKTTDQGGLFYEKQLTVSVTDVNENPTNLTLSNNIVAENSPINTPIGNFTTTDPDTGNTFNYSLVTGIGSTDNSLFTIDGNQLKTNAIFDYETKNNYSIRVKTTDQGGLSYEKQLTVNVNNIPEQRISIDKNAITFGTPLSQYRQGWSNSNLVRPKFADTFRYIDITNTGVNAEDILAISNIEVKASNVTTNADFSQGDILLNPGQTWRVQLTYAPTAARESFNLNDGLVIHSNAINNTAYNVGLTGKSTFNSDITYNGKVDRGDLAPLQAAFNSSIGSPKYDPTADINGDGGINLGDFLVLNSDYGLSLF